jgi:hypothetical protein
LPRKLLIETSMEPLTVTDWEFKDAIIGSQNKDVASRVDDCRADLTVLQVSLHQTECFNIKRVIEIIGDIRPDVLAL